MAAIATGKDRQSLFSEYIRIHWRTTGKIAPGCDAKDFYAALDKIARESNGNGDKNEIQSTS